MTPKSMIFGAFVWLCWCYMASPMALRHLWNVFLPMDLKLSIYFV